MFEGLHLMVGETKVTENNRKAERLDFVKLATIHIDGEKNPVKIVNVSDSGTGIWGLELQKGQTIEVEWKKGEKLKATVAWAMGEAAGLVFEDSLEAEHPLMSLAQGSK